MVLATNAARNASLAPKLLRLAYCAQTTSIISQRHSLANLFAPFSSCLRISAQVATTSALRPAPRVLTPTLTQATVCPAPLPARYVYLELTAVSVRVGSPTTCTSVTTPAPSWPLIPSITSASCATSPTAKPVSTPPTAQSACRTIS